jgi:predicted phosphodiesterase
VVADIGRRGVDGIVCLGDVATLGPDPAGLFDRLIALGCPCILGNHDAFLLDADLIRSYTEIPAVVEAVDWCRERVRPGDLTFLRSFVPRLELPLGEHTTLLAFHGAPRSHMQDLLCTTPAAELDAHLDGFAATVMAGGHTHVQMLRQHRGTLLVNPGSVGSPFREFVSGGAPTLGDWAEYAIVGGEGGDVTVELHRVQLERKALHAAAAKATGNALRGFWMGQYA